MCSSNIIFCVCESGSKNGCIIFLHVQYTVRSQNVQNFQDMQILWGFSKNHRKYANVFVTNSKPCISKVLASRGCVSQGFTLKIKRAIDLD